LGASAEGIVSIVVKNLQTKLPVNSRVLRSIKNAVRKTLESGKIENSGEITVCLVDDRHITSLNRRYLKTNRPTDVIAFTINKKPIMADIVISAPTAISNAKIFRTSPVYELLLYAVHGALHVLGNDDKTMRLRTIMQRKAEHILTSIGVLKNGPS
jgi:probable rRNA maturation factor